MDKENSSAEEITENSETENNSKQSAFKTFLKKYSILIVMLTVFYTVAITLWLALDEIFYLLNFGIIGTSIALGIGLWPIFPKKKRHIARKISQVLVGGYMFFGLGFGLIYLVWGFIQPENMQFEGFWFWLIALEFAAGVIHYSIAKIFGVLIFGRGWCGWSCWTAAILDLLPWSKSPGRKGKWGYLRYGFFALSTILVFVLVFGFGYNLDDIGGLIDFTGSYSGELLKSSIWQIHEFWWFLIGNTIYFVVSIVLAAILRDNRAFCKYVCPIAPFMKVGSRAAIMKVAVDEKKCIQCRACEKACPMDIKILEYANHGKRVTSTECIFCWDCINACNKSAIRLTFKLDIGFKEHLYEQKRQDNPVTKDELSEKI
ncbi:MAG: 4Fe-4S binding protein [Candidatus Heimdallarchaeota archaeon]|nr:4Fe-4S binding protein [Candidatus Heimdallarchaeota archaeon]MCK5183455.1 4Fe-4S binding protein [Candidatus Heimdallarchaeota archaeon]